MSSSSSTSTSSGRYRGSGPEASRAGAPGSGGKPVMTPNASAAVGGNATTAVRKNSGPLQKTVWGKPVVETVEAAKKTNTPVATAAKTVWGLPAKPVAPVDATPAPPKSVWNQPAQIVEIPKPEQAAPEKRDDESAKKSAAFPDSKPAVLESPAVIEPEDSSLKKSSQILPPTASWASTVASGKLDDPVKTSALPPTAAWAKTGSQSQPDVTQTALAENSVSKNSSVPSPYVAPKAPWAKPEIPNEPVETDSAVVAPIAPVAAPIEAVEAPLAAVVAPVEAAVAPVPADETRAVIPDVDIKLSAVLAPENVSKEIEVSPAEPPVKTDEEKSQPTTTAIEPGVTNNVDEGPNSGKPLESGEQTPKNEESKTDQLDQNSNKTDEINSPSGSEDKPVLENDSSSSSKSGSQTKLKFSYKDGKSNILTFLHFDKN